MARGCGCGNATRHLSGAKKSSHKNSIYSCGYSGNVMAFTADQVLDLLDSSGESEIEEDPGFLLPQESDSDCEEPLPSNSFTLHQSSQPIASEDSDSSYEECIDQGIILDNHTIKIIQKRYNSNKNLVLEETSTGRGGGGRRGRGCGEGARPRRGRGRGRGRGRARGYGRRIQGVSQIPWQAVDSDTDAAPPPLPFTKPVGPSVVLPESSTPFDYFSQIVDRSIVEILTQETNK